MNDAFNGVCKRDQDFVIDFMKCMNDTVWWPRDIGYRSYLIAWVKGSLSTEQLDLLKLVYSHGRHNLHGR